MTLFSDDIKLRQNGFAFQLCQLCLKIVRKEEILDFFAIIIFS